MNTRMLQWRTPGSKSFSMAVAGDFCPREENCADLTARAAEIAAPVKPFFDSADMRVLQWECTVTRQDTPIDKSGPNHRCYPECTVFAEALNIDTVLLANNHTGDYGAPGVKDSLEAFARLNIRTVGAGMNEAEAALPVHAEYNGLKVSLINAAEYEFGIAYGDTPGAYGLDPVKLAAQIKAEKENNDLVVVTLHGGHEHLPFPTPRMRSWFRFFADCGADAVFNCHTHCPEGYEIYNGVPIVYSPGNFYFPNRPTSLPCWYIGYVPKFLFDADGAYGMELLPYFNYKAGLKTMNEEESAAFFAYIDTLNAPIADEKELQKIFDAWSSKSGYFNGFFNREKPESFDVRESVKANLGLRNLMTCASHYDLLRNDLLLMERYELSRAQENFHIIEKAQHPEFVKL
ncbi:MAG: CapA family protein [Lentisphaerae bacterium]|nr:CapA family protein [Lentisphaerota bacterium]